MITKRHTLSSQRLPGPLSEFAARNGVDASKGCRGIPYSWRKQAERDIAKQLDSVYKLFYGFGYLIFDDDDLP